MKYFLESRNNPKLLTIIIPCYNEESVLPYLKDRLNRFLETLPTKTEVIFVNDGSDDDTIFSIS